ncbi:MAG: hypothetical protein Tsb004_15480 [Allomuricauda sp.]
MENRPKSGYHSSELKLLDNIIDSILNKTNIPGASMAVCFKERLVYERGHGYSKLNGNDTIAIQYNAVFRIASISKTITATTIMHLVERQKLALDDKIYNILKTDLSEIEITDDRIKDITIKDLLGHTGGWNRNISGDPGFNVLRMSVAMGDNPPGSELAVIRYMMGLPLDYTPGSQQVYSNFGYMILGRVIEIITGKPYEAYVLNQILRPNGITTMEIGAIVEDNLQENEVFYHDSRVYPSVLRGGGAVQAPFGAFNLKAMKAHGGWVSSASDLLRFITAVYGKSYRKDILLPESIQSMTRPLGNFKTMIHNTAWDGKYKTRTMNQSGFTGATFQALRPFSSIKAI